MGQCSICGHDDKDYGCGTVCRMPNRYDCGYQRGLAEGRKKGLEEAAGIVKLKAETHDGVVGDLRLACEAISDAIESAMEEEK